MSISILIRELEFILHEVKKKLLVKHASVSPSSGSPHKPNKGIIKVQKYNKSEGR
jgi:hypothetical protein